MSYESFRYLFHLGSQQFLSYNLCPAVLVSELARI